MVSNRTAYLLRFFLGLALLAGFVILGRDWLADHPEHNPWAPLDLDDPLGWATERKIASLRSDPAECRAVLVRSDVSYEQRPDVGEEPCRRINRVMLEQTVLTPGPPSTTCAVGVGLEMWFRHGVQPNASQLLGSPVAGIEHLGAYSCRRLYGRDSGDWSEHATANAIDIAAFVLEDGRRISVLDDWLEGGPEAEFLKRVRDSACLFFGTVLSPDYNLAHADHFHLDQKARPFGGACR